MTYILIYSGNSTTYNFSGYGTLSETRYFMIRPCITKNKVVYEYGAWSTKLTVKQYVAPATSTKADYGDCVGTLTAASVGINNVKITLGVEQSIIDNNEIGMYFYTIDFFGKTGITLFGHNNKSMGKIKNLKNGDIISIKDNNNNKTLKYQVYYVGECRKSSDMKYMVDIYTGHIIDPFVKAKRL